MVIIGEKTNAVLKDGKDTVAQAFEKNRRMLCTSTARNLSLLSSLPA